MLSVVVLYNQVDQRVRECLESVVWVDEIICVYTGVKDHEKVVNSIGLQGKGSTMDKKSGKNGEVVHMHVPLEGDFSAIRNKADAYAHGEWILHVDADEVVDEVLRQSVRVAIGQPEGIGRIRRYDLFLGKKVTRGEVANAYKKGMIRLYSRQSGVWQGKVHEAFVPDQSKSISISQLNGFLVHNAHQTVADFLRSINVYSRLRAEELVTMSKIPTVLSMYLNPIGKFLYTYFLKLGFLDGPEGWIYSFMMAYHSFLVRAKAIMIFRKDKDTLKSQSFS